MSDEIKIEIPAEMLHNITEALAESTGNQSSILKKIGEMEKSIEDIEEKIGLVEKAVDGIKKENKKGFLGLF